MPLPSFAIRPFVTDDARILDIGHLGSEIWFEKSQTNDEAELTQHALLSWNVYKWFEVTAVGNFGRDNGKTVFYNPVLQGKLLLRKASSEGKPGFALSMARSSKDGSGKYRENASSAYALALTTFRLKNDHLVIHANLGATRSNIKRKKTARLFWGVGFDHSLWSREWRIVGETYSGDPYSAYRSPFAVQSGMRWLYGAQCGFDFVVGGQPVYNETGSSTGETEYWAQLGVRLSIDLYSDSTGHTHGALGILN